MSYKTPKKLKGNQSLILGEVHLNYSVLNQITFVMGDTSSKAKEYMRLNLAGSYAG